MRLCNQEFTSLDYMEGENTIPPSIERLTPKGIPNLINTNYIVCFECRERGHYKNRCPSLMKKKVQVVHNGRVKEKSIGVIPLRRKARIIPCASSAMRRDTITTNVQMGGNPRGTKKEALIRESS